MRKEMRAEFAEYQKQNEREYARYLRQTWQEYKVTSEVPNFDPYQWVNYTLEWTPSAPGKYQVKLDAIDTEGNHIPNPVTLFVNVEE